MAHQTIKSTEYATLLLMGSQVIGGEVIEQSGDSHRIGGGARLRLRLRMGSPRNGGDEGEKDAASETQAGPASSGAQQQQQQQQQGEVMGVDARCVINSAGLHAQEVAACIRGLPAAAIPPRHLAKGNYFSLASSLPSSSSPPTALSSSLSDTQASTPSPSTSTSAGTPFARLVYPVPEPGGLGIHYTLDMAGRAKFGPDVEWVQGVDYVVRARCECEFKLLFFLLIIWGRPCRGYFKHAGPDLPCPGCCPTALLQVDPSLPLPSPPLLLQVEPSRAERFYALMRRYLPSLPPPLLCCRWTPPGPIASTPRCGAICPACPLPSSAAG